jgi:hypothetical protein
MSLVFLSTAYAAIWLLAVWLWSVNAFLSTLLPVATFFGGIIYGLYIAHTKKEPAQ